MNNREFKFRVWDKVNKAYCHCGELNFLSRNTSKLLDGKIRLSGQLISSNLETYLTANDADVCMPHANPKPYVIEQYTGVKDKNGREIYEGDILEHPVYRCCSIDQGQYSKCISQVKWGETGDTDGWSYDGHFTYVTVEYHSSLHDIYEYSTVIGNIHENPELLEDE